MKKLLAVLFKFSVTFVSCIVLNILRFYIMKQATAALLIPVYFIL